MTKPAPTPRPLEPQPPTGDPRLDALRRLLAIVDRLRDPEDGCPWDLEQSVESMAPSLIEEAHELVEAIEQRAAAAVDEPGAEQEHVVEEAGDLLMLVVLIARIAAQAGRFDIAEVAQRVGDKLVRRHPHVFGSVDVDSSAHVVANWERIKKEEREAKGGDASALAGVPKALPALQRADRLAAKAIAAGFRWSDETGALAKLHEEVGELQEAFEARDTDVTQARLRHELGDVLLAAAACGTYLGIDPEQSLREAARRYEQRFRAMESGLGGSLAGANLERMLAGWERAKAEQAAR